MPKVLQNKRCLVTGATGGLGRELSSELGRRGASLFLTGRNPDVLNSLSREFECPSKEADLSLTSEVEGLIAEVIQALGGLDVFVHAAGIFPVGPIGEVDLGEFDRCLAVNLRAAFQLAQAFGPKMAAQSWGRILFIGSSSAYAGFRETAVYCASKHGLLGLARALQDELKGSNVRVVCVSPGSIQTPMGRLVRGQDFTTFLEPADVARFAIDLISQDGSMVVDEVRLNRVVLR